MKKVMAIVAAIGAAVGAMMFWKKRSGKDTGEMVNDAGEVAKE